MHEARAAGPCPFRAPSLESLLDRFGTLRDPRQAHWVRHRQHFVLACAAVSTLMGAYGYRAFENTCGGFHWPHGQNQHKPESKTGTAEGAKNLTARRLTFQVAMESLTPTSPTLFLFQVNQPRLG